MIRKNSKQHIVKQKLTRDLISILNFRKETSKHTLHEIQY